MSTRRVSWLAIAMIVTCAAAAQESRVPQWDARGVGWPPAQDIACLDVSRDGQRIVVGTIAMPGEPNVHVLNASGKVERSYQVGQRWIAQVVATESDKPFALCTMTSGTAGDEPLVYLCGDPATAIAGGAGGTSLFHYGDHGNHIGKQLLAYPAGAVTVNENQLLWLAAGQGTPQAKSSLRNLKATALAVHPSGVAIIGGYFDGEQQTQAAMNLAVYRPGATSPLWSRAIVREVCASSPPEPGEYGRPVLVDGSREPLPQRDDLIFAPLSIAVTQEEQYADSQTQIATVDYRGWQRMIRSSATGKEESYGARFMPAKPTVAVYDSAGTVVRRFDAEKFSQALWVDVAFLPNGQKLIAYPHSWACRGLASQSRLPSDDNARTMWLLDIKSGDVVPRELPEAIASISVSEQGTVVVSCWNGQLYRFDLASLTTGALPTGIDLGGPALVHVDRDGGRVVAATHAGEVVLIGAKGDVQQRVDLNRTIPRQEKSWVKNAIATQLAPGLWQLPGGRVESDLGGQRVIEAPDGLILIEAHAGLSFEREWKAIEAAGLDPRRVKYVLGTHEHGDHAPGAALWRVATGAQFVCSREMAYTLQHHLPVGTGYGFHPPVRTDIKIDEDQVLDLAGLRVAALRLPGHTFGSMGWLFERDGKKFVAIGDLIMPEGRLGYSGSINFSPHQVLASLRKLDGLRVDTILPGHGPVVGPDKYVMAGIAIGTRVGWGKMTPESPDPRFAITQPNVLVVGFLAGATSADFGDIDGDGRPDVAIVAPHGSDTVVKVFLNRHEREPRFDPMKADFEVTVAGVDSPSKLRLRALNDDHRLDIFISGRSTAALLVSRETLGEYDIQTVSTNEKHQLRVVDLTGNGARDRILLGRFGPAQHVVTGPNGRLATKSFSPPIQSPYADFHELDLNGDGRTDWIASNGRVWLRGANGYVPTEPTRQLPLPVAGDWSFCSVGDINGDRKPDVALISYGMQRRVVKTFHNNGDSRLPFDESPNSTFEIDARQPHVRDNAPFVDFNGDGFDDLMIGLGQDNQVRGYLGSATGLSGERVETITLEFWIQYEHGLKIADFNADGLPDIGGFGYTQTGVGLSGPPAAYIWLKP